MPWCKRFRPFSIGLVVPIPFNLKSLRAAKFENNLAMFEKKSPSFEWNKTYPLN